MAETPPASVASVDKLVGRAPASLGLEPPDRRRATQDVIRLTAKNAVSPTAESVAQYYSQSTVAKGAGTRRGAGGNVVLASFQFEQRGQSVNIVDADGSVYTGLLGTVTVPAPASRFGASARAPKEAGPVLTATIGRDAAAADANPAWWPDATKPSLPFTVWGTNSTLKQVVTFTGQLNPGWMTTQLGASNQPVQFRNQLEIQNALQNSRLTGRARLADGRELEIDAQASPTK